MAAPDTLRGEPGCADRRADLPARSHTPATSRRPLPAPLPASARRSCPAADRRVRWCSRAVNRSPLPFPRCLAHTRQPLGHALFPLCVGGVLGLTGVLLGPRPSLPSLRRRRLSRPPLFGWFIGTTAQSDSSAPFMPVVRLCLLRPVCPAVSCRRIGGLPVLVHEVSQRAGVYDYAGSAADSRLSPARMWPSPSVHRVGTPDCVFEAQYPAHRCLCLRFALLPRDRPRKTRGQDGSLLLSCRDSFILYSMPVYPGARTVHSNTDSTAR